jgi:DNA-binding NtrC family response regulator
MAEPMETRRKVLAAMRQEGVVAVERALGRYVEVVPAHTFEIAVKRLESAGDIRLVLCGMYFAETRMFDLLRFVKEKCPGVPIVCCRIGQSEVPKVTLEAVGIAAKSMGAADFVDIPLLRPDAAADQEFRGLVLRHLR